VESCKLRYFNSFEFFDQTGMFDSVACCRMRMAKVPTVSCGALLDLKALLRCASFPDSAFVLQDQHRSLLSPEGADARITKPAESHRRVKSFWSFTGRVACTRSCVCPGGGVGKIARTHRKRLSIP
jgi:hypothetical protein